ncbi:MAG: group II intron reverse transcriptase/maturase [Leptospirales bacterium]
MSRTKSFEIEKQAVWEAFKLVKANRGAAGVDGQSIRQFEEKLSDNLYKLWNRMSSGSYFPPPVKAVEIPKKSGGKRTLGIPTVADRTAQMVVKMKIEPLIEPVFHHDSYGYRPGKSAKDALAITRKRCWEYDWVLEFDIKGLFDNIDHTLLMKAIQKHVKEEWIILYLKRWLVAPLSNVDGDLVERKQGTPQGGVISPLLANLFLHYVFDLWMQRNHPHNPFARYADDGIVHCKTEKEACEMRDKIASRLVECKLEIHPVKTRIVYCRDYKRTGKHSSNSFDFLGFAFRPRRAKGKKGNIFMGFLPAISNGAKKSIKQTIRSWNIPTQTAGTIEELSKYYNPALRGWINYYGSFYPSELATIYRHFDHKLIIWAMRKYKRMRGKYKKTQNWLIRISQANPDLFHHWRIGHKPSGWIIRAV